MIEKIKKIANYRTPVTLVFAIALITVTLLLTMSSESTGGLVERKPVYRLSATVVDQKMANYLKIDPYSMISMSYSDFLLSLKKETPYRYEKQKADPEAGACVMRIELGYDESAGFEHNTVVHIPGVYGQAFRIYDENGEKLYEYKSFPLTKYYTKLLSEQYLLTSSKTIYVLSEYDKGDIFLGLSGKPETMEVSSSIKYAAGAYQTRHALAVFLVLISAILLVMAHTLKIVGSKDTMCYIAVFSCLFGAWILMDFPRQSYNIMATYRGISPVVLLLIYIISKNFMSWAFVKMNSYFLEKDLSRIILRILVLISFFAGFFETIMDILRFFDWGPKYQLLKNISFSIADWSISIGSLVLLALAVYEAFGKNLRAKILSVGLVICLFTFFISQTTSLLISHWGVIALASSIAIIFATTYNETQRKMENYLLVLEDKNKKMAGLNADLDYAQTELLLRLGSTVDMRSHETSMHVQRVARFTELIAKEIGMSDEESEVLSKASTLHDVGKVGISDAILNSPNRLSTEEYEEMKLHAKKGFEILNGSFVQILDVAAIVALTHHERYDGSGYPNGMKGDEIPVYGRVVAAADVFDALLSPRVYKKAWTLDEVLAYFSEEKSKHFEPRIVEAILRNRAALEEIIETLPYEEE